MANIIGHIEEFNPKTQDWGTYAERLGHYFNANSIDNNKKVSTLLCLIGGNTYTILRNLLAPEKPTDKTYKQLIDVLATHFSPKPLVIAERFRFRKRNQEHKETVTDYAAVLRQMSRYCEFNAVLDDNLRDQFVCGLTSEAAQKRLITEEELSFNKALKIAHSMETAVKDIGELKLNVNHSSETPVYKVQNYSRPQNRANMQKCRHCGKTNHACKDCCFQNSNCNSCGKKGHISTICRSKKTKPEKFKMSLQKSKKVHQVDESKSDSESESDETALFYTTQKRKSDVIWVHPKVEGVDFPMELDTGSALSIISTEYDWKIVA
ncbi:uncharacterized protein LOC121371430 isoform X2 [Gigantopelta aegis]|uniref:uncharacterized protein LOC121371430 isoform X2 n=1 Tax=Gigantopelta aegis TaxID=1735272 RepID=UPI001B88B871|nr:uncharacterized protein LOC121371430 isoform X2 [Gigantopelta aegis]